MAKKKDKFDEEEVKEILEDLEDAESDNKASEVRKLKRKLRKMGLTVEQAEEKVGGEEEEEVEIDYDTVMAMKKGDIEQLIDKAEIDVDPEDYPTVKKLRAALLDELGLTEEEEEEEEEDKKDKKGKGEIKVVITVGKKKTELLAKAGDEIKIEIKS